MNIRHLLLSFGVLATALVAQAQITFTINASPTSNDLGYVTTQNYNFVFTLTTDSNIANPANFSPGSANDNAPDTSYSSNNSITPPFFSWRQEWTTDPKLWTSVSGQGLAGTWVQPGDPNSRDPAPDSYLNVSTGNSYGPSLTLIGQADQGFPHAATPRNVGLTANGTPVDLISFFAAGFTGFNFSPTTGSTLPDPNAYFAGNAGSYPVSISSGRIEGVTLDGGGNYVDTNVFFTVNSLTVGVSAIPEPSTYAAIAGAAMLGFAAWRRRNRKNSPAVAPSIATA